MDMDMDMGGIEGRGEGGKGGKQASFSKEIRECFVITLVGLYHSKNREEHDRIFDGGMRDMTHQVFFSIQGL